MAWRKLHIYTMLSHRPHTQSYPYGGGTAAAAAAAATPPCCGCGFCYYCSRHTQLLTHDFLLLEAIGPSFPTISSITIIVTRNPSYHRPPVPSSNLHHRRSSHPPFQPAYHTEQHHPRQHTHNNMDSERHTAPFESSEPDLKAHSTPTITAWYRRRFRRLSLQGTLSLKVHLSLVR